MESAVKAMRSRLQPLVLVCAKSSYSIERVGLIN